MGEVVQGTGSVKVECPATHHGAIEMTCASKSESWTNLVGECVEKQCPSFTFESGGVEISFKAAKQGTGEVTRKCPKTHHGEVKSTCEPESELWSPMSGECREKECPRETIEWRCFN